MYVHRALTSLGFTVAVETAVLFILLYYVYKYRHLRVKDVIFAGILASSLTIPYVWFVFPYVVNWSRNTSAFFSEPFAFLIEALVYNRVLKLDWKTALAVSLVCNIASYLLGPILRMNGLWTVSYTHLTLPTM
jgi:hypothetical protein